MTELDNFFESLETGYLMKRSQTPFLVIMLAIPCLLFGSLWVAHSFNIDAVKHFEIEKLGKLTMIFAGIALYFAATFFTSAKRVGLLEINDKIPLRRKRICELVNLCEHELTIVSGIYFDEVYGSPEVLKCFQGIPESVKINLFVEKKTDCDDDSITAVSEVESHQFRELMDERGVEFQYVSAGTPHTIIVDRHSARIELQSKKEGRANQQSINDKENRAHKKKALVLYYADDIAESLSRLAFNRICS